MWLLPSNNGESITQYKVFMKEMQSTAYTLESTDCIGTDSTVISQSMCYITIETLLAEPYLVDGGDSVYAKVSAINTHGESE